MNIGVYILRRLIAMLAQLMGAIFILFFLFNIIPYDPLGIFLFNLKPASEAEREQLIESLQHQWGVDRPIYVQVSNFLQGLFFEGSLGNSWIGGSVNQVVNSSLKYTLIVLLLSLLFYIPFSIYLGLFSARKQNSKTDLILRMTTSAIYGVPYYLYAVILVVLFGSDWSIEPKSSNNVITYIPSIILAVGIVVLVFTTYQFRLIRNEIQIILHMNYIKTARAKGLHERVVIYKHALLNAIRPIILNFAVNIPVVISAIVVLETLLYIPGIGNIVVKAAIGADWGMIIGISTVFLLLNSILILITDVFLNVYDPLQTET